jgi:hypothetical protein
MTNQPGRYPAQITILKNVPRTTSQDLAGIFKNFATLVAATTTIIITPDDMMSEPVTVERNVTFQNNTTGASEAARTITKTGMDVMVKFTLSFNQLKLIDYFFRGEVFSPSVATEPGFVGYSDEAGLTPGTCAGFDYETVVVQPIICGVPTTDVTLWDVMPWSTPKPESVSAAYALGSQYGYTNLSFQAFPAPSGVNRGKYRLIRGAKPLSP